ncbi:SDR family oxidoreductase [Vibrio aestuarianus subsp. cardii]|uniref:UDP-glucose 4-epimerase family protein n=1 Tax=Vibrio aestuarianus TaxID=28171 RepID=UPI001593BAC9|nr:SDR family oxidoreductase [Vibrio aestuarianus]MDE1309888.1 SDR family oxidoreductase [Vibrio aestuarianus]NGZ18929.1 SDR family oxidoreductase [Vibrio aestuarianus]NGZ93962.1 SDR family oxidoreductase [Vibrio aestuarianus subsp. cardii]
MKVAVTGATGFLGKALVESLKKKSVQVIQIGRGKNHKVNGEHIYIKTIDSSSQYNLSVNKPDVIVHCAARVHVMNDAVSNPLEEYREVNTRGTINLARQAASAGVKRFVFVSSIKVNGEGTSQCKLFTSADAHAPEDDYGLSKAEAEQQLIELGQETGMEVVIIRPTLVYGPGVKANFASLMNLVSKGIPLPFGCINDNRRSLVSVANLVDLVVTCIDHPNAANETFLVSDDCDVSTSEMVTQMAKALGKPQWQLPVPKWCYKLAGKALGKQNVIDRLLGSLQVDITHTKNTLGWAPPQSLEEGFKQTADAFLQSKKTSGNI